MGADSGEVTPLLAVEASPMEHMFRRWLRPAIVRQSPRRSLARVALFALVGLVGLSLPGPRARAAACHSTCTIELKACKRTCGGSGGSRRACRAACAERSSCTAPGARIGTLAYVLTECREDPQGFLSGRQKLMIRRGNCDPIVAMESPVGGLAPVADPVHLCPLYGETRAGQGSVVVGIFQHIGVLPNGSGVVFEVTDGVSLFQYATPRLPDDGKGIFFVRADGGGLRRLTRRTTDIPIVALGGPSGFAPNDVFYLAISPDSRTVAFSGLDRLGSPQIFTLDIASGDVTDLTSERFPGGLTSTATTSFPYPSFADNHTVLFFTNDVQWKVGVDGSQPEPLPNITIGGGVVVPSFSVSGGSGSVVHGLLPGDVEGPNPNGDPISEVFLIDGPRLLQVTRFHRADTIGWSIFRGRVLVQASATPGDLCQLFSVGGFSGKVRQLTHLPPDASGGRQTYGCFAPGLSGAECTISTQGVAQDAKSGAILFQSSCDPLGSNPFGTQLFVMRADGTGLRQITRTRGRALEPDGSVSVEAPGPIGYAAEHPG